MNERHDARVELLAPAGGYDALVAAVNNGADAVYLGLGELNARRGAGNFNIETLALGARFAHLRGVRVYLTANVVVLPEEMQRALEMIDEAWAAGVDAVIVQDLGLLGVLRQELPDVRIHASTQVDAMNPEGVRVLAGLGVSRVTLARELDLRSIAACAATGVEIETFVHGAICYSYSGQCLLSSMIGRRSANRGMCAQPCRLPYELVGPDGTVADIPGRYLLSPRDMAGIAHLPGLVSAGVRSLKIEGRMKSPEYVAVVTGVYRGALDRALADPETYEVRPSEWALLEEAFSRGFTDAYLTGERGEALMSYARPNNRGVLLGRIVDIGSGGATVELERALDARDRIEIWTRSGRFAQHAGELEIDGRRARSAPARARVRLVLERSASPGDRVFRVADATLEDAARRTFEGAAALEMRAVPVRFAVSLRTGEPLTVTAESGGVIGMGTGPAVEPARTKAITADEVIEHTGRLGGSGFTAAGWELEIHAGVGIGYSALHAARREALEGLAAQLLAPWNGRAVRHPRLARMQSHARPRRTPPLVAVAWDAETAAACVSAGADETYLRVFGPPDAVEMPDGIRPLLPRVAWPGESGALAHWLDAGPAAVGNLGLLESAGSWSHPVSADWPLNVTNAYSAAALAGLGATFVWASPEISGRQLEALAGSSPVPVGCVIWGRLELMVAEQCVLQAAGPCSRRCGSCSRRRGWWHVRDRKGYEFPVTTDSSGRSHIVNAVTLDLTRALAEVLDAGVAAVRLEFTNEPPTRAAEIVRAVAGAVAAVAAGADAPSAPFADPATSGHFFRGVL